MASICVVVVINHAPCDSVELERLSKLFVVWAAACGGASALGAVVFLGIAIVITVVGNGVVYVRL